jgi:hypothetical protein
MYGMQPEFQFEVHITAPCTASTSGPVCASPVPDLRTSFQTDGSFESSYEKNSPDYFRYKTKSEYSGRGRTGRTTDFK